MMRGWMIWLLMTGLVGAVEPAFVEKPVEKLSAPVSSEWGKLALGLSPGKWKHGETEHFIIHFQRRGDSVASRSEKFYGEIREFFGNRPDLMKGKKSHVFAFHDGEDWKKFASGIGQSWAGGITRGDEFFYRASSDTGAFDSEGRTQAHEMTHLVFNRFFTGTPPLWLNEGIAEYYGSRKTSTVTEFRRQMSGPEKFPLDELLAAQRYPERLDQVQAFYAEAAIVVDYLTSKEEWRKLLPKFVDAFLAGQTFEAAVGVYGFRSRAEFDAAYKKHRRKFNAN